ncbi:disease resistance protein [Canna indica]|uniref:Disease resistance protein n=1 Tax=Canna indica TaxID=4628 RepID=A0AAQ3KUZ7_9LILI|nr:disease resistance protein [Canna indica]
MFKKGPYVTAWMESIDWEAIKQHETTCFDILALSYDDLPSDNLRSCFLYLASFPEDSIISATKLIRLWIAEGFVQQKRNRILEQTARTYLDELVQRCMVQVAEISLAHGWVNRVRIHDVLREWCIAEARKEEFLYVFDKLENNDSPSVDGMPFRRVALLDKMDDRLLANFLKLRTLLAFGGGVVNPTSITMYFSHLCFVKVLDLQGTKNLKEIPKDIKKMIHLRYLGLRDTDFKIIPSSIGELQYLQTLDARRSKIEQLPITFWKIPTLRNVHTFLPMRTSIISNFKTLHVVKWIEAGEWIETCNATNFHKLAIVEILEVHRSSLSRFLKNQYKLVSLSVIISDQNGTRIVTDIMESFSNHHQLRSLCLRSGIFKTVIEHLPRICEFLPTLTKLKLWCLWFMEDPMEQLERLPNLLHLHIRALSDEIGRRLGDSSVKSFKTMTCTAGGFPNLQSFEFWGSDVEEWKVEISAMPKLTYLYINYMKKLRSIPDGLLHITSLNELMFNLMSSEFVDRIREGDGVSWNIIRDEDEGKHMTIVPIRPIDSTNNVLPGCLPGSQILQLQRVSKLMAAAVVSTFTKFGDLIVQEANFLGGFPDGAAWLNRELQWIQSFLTDANSRRRKGDERTKTLTRQIRDVAYEIEDLTDIIRSMSHESRYQRRCFLVPILRYALHPLECLSVHRVLVSIQRIEKKIRDISNSIQTYGVKLAESSSSGGDVEENIGVYRHYEADEDVVGFDNDKKELLRRLLVAEEINQRRRSVISIVGMGGIGKTTLARKLFNDSEVKRHFQVLCWVTVSQSYSAADILKTIAKKIMVGIEKEQLRNMEYEEVREELAKHLAGKRYLIVLDDVWETRAWARMKDAFPHCSQNGSRVVLTSRNIDVARSADPLSVPYELPLLDEEDSWKLLRKKAFPSPKGIEPSCPKQLEDIGRRLAKKCGGLALALVMLGGLVFKKGPSVAAWMELVESIDWEAAKEHETTCFDILALSYDDLPSHNLRSCFLYLASFPEDSEISVSILINLWIAEGFVEQKHNRILEQTARTYLDELVQRCMVQVTKKSIVHGWVNRVGIHDVLREWCIAEARREEFLYVSNKLENNDSPCVDGMSFRRVALLDKMDDQLHVHFPKLRTLMAFGGGVDIANRTRITMYFSHLHLLRVLDLEGVRQVREIPKDIKNMIHLRYLGLRDTDFKIIPSSIGELQYLQTLDSRRSAIEQLPRTFWKIPTLRNVYGGREFTPIIRTSRIPNCKALHVVKWIEAGEWIATCNATNFHKLAIAEILEVHRNALSQFLKSQYKLVSLGLHIFEDNGTRIVTDIIESFSSHHDQLRSLRLISGKYKTVIGHLPRICEFLPNLTKLVFVEFKFLEDPMEQLERLRNLLHLRISASSDVGTFKIMTCTAGGFPNLQSFEFWGSDVEEWKVEIFAMPKLTNLSINYMDMLRNIPDGLLHITSLSELIFICMPSEFVDRIREGDGVRWNIIRDRNEGKFMSIVPIQPIDSTNNVLPDSL